MASSMVARSMEDMGFCADILLECEMDMRWVVIDD